MFRNMATGLAAVDIITDHEAHVFITLYESDPLLASFQLLTAWTAADKAGKRTQYENTTLIPPAKYEGLKRSPLRTDVLQFAFGSEQKESIDYIVDGLTHGFSIHREGAWNPVQFESYQTEDKREQEYFDKFIEKEMNQGFTCYWTKELGPEWNIDKCQINPTFLREKMKTGTPIEGQYRKIGDLSHGTLENPSVNGTIPTELGKVTFPTVHHHVKNVQDLQDYHKTIQISPEDVPDVRQAKADVQSAYRQYPMKEAEWHMLMSTDRSGRPIIDSRMQMGLGPAARIYSAVSLPQDWLIRHVFKVLNVSMLDDAAQAALGTRNIRLSHGIVILWLELFGYPMAHDKSEVDERIMTFLGTEVNTINNSLTLPAGKVERIKKVLADWKSKSTATIHEVQVLTGVLCDVARVITQGRVFLNRLYRLMHYGNSRRDASKNPRFYRVDIGWRQQADLDFWRKLLDLTNRHITRRFPDSRLPSLRAVSAKGDACDKRIAGIVGDRVWTCEFGGELKYLEKTATTTAVREMAVLVINAGTFGHEWTGRHVVFECDNESDVKSFQKMKNKNDTTEHFMRVLSLLAILHDFTYSVEWLSTADNEMADDATRLDMSVVLSRWPQLSQWRGDVWLPPRANDPSWQEKMMQAILAKHGHRHPLEEVGKDRV